LEGGGGRREIVVVGPKKRGRGGKIVRLKKKGLSRKTRENLEGRETAPGKGKKRGPTRAPHRSHWGEKKKESLSRGKPQWACSLY